MPRNKRDVLMFVRKRLFVFFNFLDTFADFWYVRIFHFFLLCRDRGGIQ